MNNLKFHNWRIKLQPVCNRLWAVSLYNVVNAILKYVITLKDVPKRSWKFFLWRFKRAEKLMYKKYIFLLSVCLCLSKSLSFSLKEKGGRQKERIVRIKGETFCFIVPYNFFFEQPVLFLKLRKWNLITCLSITQS